LPPRKERFEPQHPEIKQKGGNKGMCYERKKWADMIFRWLEILARGVVFTSMLGMVLPPEIPATGEAQVGGSCS
jgi:hypothetical protein